MWHQVFFPVSPPLIEDVRMGMMVSNDHSLAVRDTRWSPTEEAAEGWGTP